MNDRHVGARTDEDIKADVVERLRWDERVDPSRVQVTVAGFSGVRDIRNHLSVVREEEYLDQALAQSVTSALERNVRVDTDSITAEVDDGIVTLTGAVPDWPAFGSAFRTASVTAGVKDVNNHLVVYP